MKYAHTQNGKLLGWYDSDIHDEIPTPNIQVTDEQWQEAINNNHNIINEDGSSSYADTRTSEEKEVNLIAEYKTAYLDKFNAKLKEMDYDDIATVGVWAIKDGSQFQAEAKTLLNWYEAIITKNYEILNAVKSGDRSMPTKEQYLSELPSYAIYEL